MNVRTGRIAERATARRAQGLRRGDALAAADVEPGVPVRPPTAGMGLGAGEELVWRGMRAVICHEPCLWVARRIDQRLDVTGLAQHEGRRAAESRPGQIAAVPGRDVVGLT